MWCWHKWTEWEQYDLKKLVVFADSERYFPGKKYVDVEHWQRRHCIKCKYEQKREIWEH